MNIENPFIFKPLSFKLTVNDQPLLNTLNEAIHTLATLEKNAGTGSDYFKNAVIRLRAEISKGTELDKILDSKIMLRAYAISVAEKDIQAAGISEKALDAIDQLTQKPTSQLLSHLLTWYVTDYDKLKNYEILQYWLKKHIQLSPVHFKKWLIVLQENAPYQLVKLATDHHCSLIDILTSEQLTEIQGGELFDQAQQIFYLETLKKLAANEDSPIFQQIIKENVYKSRFKMGTYLGVEVLKILIDRMPEKEPLGKIWKKVLINIGEDPRLPETATMYRTWWQPLGKDRIEKAQAWFSKMDLSLFLKVIEAYAQQSRDQKLQRMFPARKFFLEGLFNAGYVQGSRLYLSRDADNYVKRYLNVKELPKYSTVSTDNKSIIYLKLTHNNIIVHLIEGSHDCYMWLHPRLPEKNIISNYSRINPTYKELTVSLNKNQPVMILHAPDSWQYNAILKLRNMGIPIYPEDVIPKNELSLFNQKYGYKL